MQIKMADVEYFALERVSFSSLKYILSSPTKYLHQKQFPFRGNDATELGTAIHMWLQGEKDKIMFEPDLSQLKTKEGVIAKNPRMTTQGKELIEEFRASVPRDKVAATFETRTLLYRVEEEFKSNPDIQQLITKVKDIEGAYLTEIEGVPFKGKLDFEGKDFIMDLKSSGRDADPSSFGHTVRNSHYDLQAAIYLTMKAAALQCNVSDLDYYIVAVETFAPYDVYPYKLSQETRERGFQKLEKAIQRYKSCILNKSEGKHNRISDL